jgi:hypothetical protein
MTEARVGSYLLDRALRRGPRAELWDARLAGTEQRVLLYRVADDAVLPWASVADAIEALTRSPHPGLRRIVLAGPLEEGWGIAYAWVEGVALSTLLERLERDRRPLSPAIVLHLGLRVAEALGSALAIETREGASLALVHGHLTPADVWLDVDGEVVVAGLGVPAIEEQETRASPFPVRGTLAYLAPEQLRGGQVTPRSDVFTLGVLLHEAAQLAPLFRADGPDATARAVLERPVPNLDDTILGFPSELARVIRRALARPIDERWSSALELGAALDQLAPTILGASEARAALAFLVARARSRAPEQALVSELIPHDPRAKELAATEVAEARAPDDGGRHKARTEAVVLPDELERAAARPGRGQVFDDPTVSVAEDARAALDADSSAARDPASTSERVRAVDNRSGAAARAARPSAAPGGASAQVPTRVTAESFADWLDRHRVVVFGALGVTIVALLGVLVFARTDVRHDRRLEVLVEQRAWAEAERYYLAHVADFRAPDRAFALAAEARAERLGLRAPIVAVDAPAAPREVAGPGVAVRTASASGPASLPELSVPEAFPEEDARSRADKKHRARIRKILGAALRAEQDGDLVEAEHALRRCVELEANPACHFHLARVYRRLGSVALEAEQLERYLAAWPEAPEQPQIRAVLRAAGR